MTHLPDPQPTIATNGSAVATAGASKEESFCWTTTRVREEHDGIPTDSDGTKTKTAVVAATTTIKSLLLLLLPVTRIEIPFGTMSPITILLTITHGMDASTAKNNYGNKSYRYRMI